MSTLTPPQSLNALILDDNEDDIILLTSHLKQIDEYGITVSSSQTDEDAIRILDSEPIDLIFCDYFLVDGSAEGFLHYTNRQGRHIPIILVSGLSERLVRYKGYQAGADAFLAKENLSPQTLVTAIESACFVSALRAQKTPSKQAQPRGEDEQRRSALLEVVLQRMIDEVSHNIEGDILTAHNIIGKLKAISREYSV
ncbi:MAG: response regulator [Pseudomonadota bacterium]